MSSHLILTRISEQQPWALPQNEAAGRVRLREAKGACQRPHSPVYPSRPLYASSAKPQYPAIELRYGLKGVL